MKMIIGFAAILFTVVALLLWASSSGDTTPTPCQPPAHACK